MGRLLHSMMDPFVRTCKPGRMSEHCTEGTALAIDVDCYAGYRGEESPRRFRLAGTEVGVVEVLDRWLAPEYRYFKVTGSDGHTYILRHDANAGRWELTMFRRELQV
jgi:hypothetical protein